MTPEPPITFKISRESQGRQSRSLIQSVVHGGTIGFRFPFAIKIVAVYLQTYGVMRVNASHAKTLEFYSMWNIK